MSGRDLLTEESGRGPQPVQNVHPVGTGSPQCRHLGRSSGAARGWVLMTGGESVGLSDLLSHLVKGGLLLCSLATNNSAIKSVGESAAHAEDPSRF
jgi:hypothetical protein